MELSQGARKLLLQYQQWYKDLEPQENVVTISVDEVAAKVASFYEKIRGMVDWREEHLLRQTAIERMLKRRILLGNNNGKEIAEPLLQELIRAGHFPNNRIPVQKIEEVQEIINKYASFIEQSRLYVQKKDQANLEDWLLTIGACEIEEALSPRTREIALIEYMTQEMNLQIHIRKRDENRISLEERLLEIYIGVQRALFKLDDSTIALHIFRKFYPEWDHLSLNSINLIAPNIQLVQAKIYALLNHQLTDRFFRVTEQNDTPYLLLHDIISEDPNAFEQLVQDSGNFESAIQKAYMRRLKQLKSRMDRAAIFSTISVLLSKVLVAMAIEVPIDAHITHELNYTNLAWSVVIPAVFLLILVKTARSSSSENVQKVLLEVTKITFENNHKETYEISIPRKRNTAVNALLNTVYFMSFVVSFGFLALVLRSFHFSILSIGIFLLFFSLVTFAGARIRSRAKELMVVKEKTGFIYGLLEFFELPVIRVGKWLSGQISRFNILVLLLNVLIETPFQVFVEFIEQLRSFWKEKKEEIH